MAVAWPLAARGQQPVLPMIGLTGPASEIAPGGKLRVGMIAITLLGGVAEPVARFIAQKLGATVEPVMYAAAPVRMERGWRATSAACQLF